MHFIGNMLFLHISGDNVEDALGHFRYIIFYFLAAISGAILQMFFVYDLTIPNIGASAAISGVLGAYLVLFPMAKILTLIPIGFFVFNTRLPAFMFLGIWILMQFFSGLFSLQVGVINSVAYFAHIGGFSFGFIYTQIKKKKLIERLYLRERDFIEF